MKIVQNIIEELIDSTKSLANPLLKTKVLASKLGNEQLEKWVNNELQGYLIDSNLPKYRIVGSILKGSYQFGNMVYENHPLKAIGGSDELEDFLMGVKLNSGIESLESLTRNDKNSILEEPLPAEICTEISLIYRKLGNRGFRVLNARKEFSVYSVKQVLGQVRSKLLELMLEIDKDYEQLDLSTLGNINTDKINQIIIQNMKQNIITGDGNIMNTGNKSKISNNISIDKRDISQLREILKTNFVEDQDIEELVEIIEIEEPDIENAKPSKKVNSWIKKMLGKSVDGTWQISIGAAGELLATAIAKYYGF